MANGVIPPGSGGAWHTAADGRPQADGRLYVDGDFPWFEPLTFERDGTVTPHQGGQDLGPRHAALNVVTNPNGDGSVRFENTGPVADTWGPQPSGGGGATPLPPYSQGDAASAALNSIDAGLATLRAILGK